ncbi:DUF4912 domain-containing protein [Desulfolucanica intricata]|uniref:DUF4912 domain-containing protein n=1 Tax=Desulfolucanica intricata TaxID=1285191 RepID=UPI00082F356A|nr:DUF4912 domain-containing protein [Desulfolucanica intricata]
MDKTDCIKERVSFVPSILPTEHYPEPQQSEPEFASFRNLDDTYNENILDLLVQIPTVVFAYWEISEHQKMAIEKNKGLYLRLYELINESLTRNSRMVKEVMVELVGSYYFKELEAGKSYYCELGWYGADDTFYSCLQSRVINTLWIDKYPYSNQVAGGVELEFINKTNLYNKDEINSLMIYMGIHLK